jgi:hypothetical protein
VKFLLGCLPDIASKKVSNNQINDGIDSSNNSAVPKIIVYL